MQAKAVPKASSSPLWIPTFVGMTVGVGKTIRVILVTPPVPIAERLHHRSAG